MAASDGTAGWRTVWITGASSGIGRELALKLAARGITVAASARSADALALLQSSAPGIKSYPLDVADAPAVEAVISQIEADLGPIDLAILNAGVWHQMSADEIDLSKIEQSMAVNYFGVANATASLIPRMRVRRRGHIAMVASVAGYVGLPRAIAYAPSKAAVISLAEALKVDVERFGIDISLVNPGFVETPMTSVNKFPMPFIMSAGEAAERIIAGLERRRFEIAFPWPLVAILRAARRAPYGVMFWFIRRFVLKQPPAA